MMANIDLELFRKAALQENGEPIAAGYVPPVQENSSIANEVSPQESVQENSSIDNDLFKAAALGWLALDPEDASRGVRSDANKLIG